VERHGEASEEVDRDLEEALDLGTSAAMAKSTMTSPSSTRVVPSGLTILPVDLRTAPTSTPSGKSMSRISLPGDGRGREHLRLDHLGLGIADRIDAAHAAVPDVAQDRGDGGLARGLM
jgi:hypothetical protein